MQKAFIDLIKERIPSLNVEQMGLLARFWDLHLKENEIQNLTRILDPMDFIEEHILDSVYLSKLQLQYPAMDLGSGGGMPGIPSAILNPKNSWVLVDSEKRKAEFLERAVGELGLTSVGVFYGRGEAYLKDHKVPTVVTRAVGSLEKIYLGIQNCSTWNTLVLLKGPKWEEEWASFNGNGKTRGKLELIEELRYVVGAEKKKRVIVKLRIVPRGTKKSTQ